MQILKFADVVIESMTEREKKEFLELSNDPKKAEKFIKDFITDNVFSDLWNLTKLVGMRLTYIRNEP